MSLSIPNTLPYAEIEVIRDIGLPRHAIENEIDDFEIYGFGGGN